MKFTVEINEIETKKVTIEKISETRSGSFKRSTKLTNLLTKKEGSVAALVNSTKHLKKI